MYICFYSYLHLYSLIYDVNITYGNMLETCSTLSSGHSLILGIFSILFYYINWQLHTAIPRYSAVVPTPTPGITYHLFITCCTAGIVGPIQFHRMTLGIYLFI